MAAAETSVRHIVGNSAAVDRGVPLRRRGASVEDVRGSPLYAPKPPSLIEAQLVELERGRDAAGFVGDQR